MSLNDYNTLREAVYKGNEQQVKFLLKEKKINPNPNKPTKMSVLRIACRSNNLDIVKLLITNPLHPANPNTLNKKAFTIFHEVWCSRNIGMIELLLNESLIKVNLDYAFYYYHYEGEPVWSPLTLAIHKGNMKLVKMLLKAGANPSYKPQDYEDDPITRAVLENNVDICRLILEHDCEANEANYSKNAALRIAEKRLLKTAIKHQNSILLDYLMQFEYNQLGDNVKWKSRLLRKAVCCGTESCLVVLLCWGIKIRSRHSTFQMAADRGLVHAMKFMSLVNPWCLQDDWLVDGKITASLSQHDTFTVELTEARKHAPRLDILCRAKIIQQMGYNPFAKAEELPLPHALREFVQLKSVIPVYQ